MIVATKRVSCGCAFQQWGHTPVITTVGCILVFIPRTQQLFRELFRIAEKCLLRHSSVHITPYDREILLTDRLDLGTVIAGETAGSTAGALLHERFFTRFLLLGIHEGLTGLCYSPFLPHFSSQPNL
jgi:hypothetical protein